MCCVKLQSFIQSCMWLEHTESRAHRVCLDTQRNRAIKQKQKMISVWYWPSNLKVSETMPISHSTRCSYEWINHVQPVITTLDRGSLEFPPTISSAKKSIYKVNTSSVSQIQCSHSRPCSYEWITSRAVCNITLDWASLDFPPTISSARIVLTR